MIRKSFAVLTLLSLSCLHAERFPSDSDDRDSWLMQIAVNKPKFSSDSGSQKESLPLADSVLDTQRLRQVINKCMCNDVNRRKCGEGTRFGHTVLLPGYRQEIIYLIKEGADPNVVFSENPYSTGGSGFCLTDIAVEHNDVGLLEFLLNQGANPNRLPGNLYSPLEQAMRHGNLKAVSLLFKWGAKLEKEVIFKLASDIYRDDKYIENPGLTVRMLELLVRYGGADVLSKNNNNETLLEEARRPLLFNKDDPRANRVQQLLINYFKQAEEKALAQQKATKESCCNCNNSNNQ